MPSSSWITRGGFALIDQGLFSATNFVVSILLARWMSAEGFGAFSVAYSVFLLVAALHTAAVSEPMLVFGAGKYGQRLGRFLALTLTWHLVTTVAAAGALTIAVGALYNAIGAPLGRAFLALATSLPLMLLYWVARRAHYIRLQPQCAAIGGVLYLVATLAGILQLHRIGMLSPATVLAVNAVASFVASLYLVSRLPVRWAPADDDPSFRATVTDYTRYARWSCAAMLVSWVPHNVFYLAAPAFGTLESAGTLRALTNVIMPLLTAMVALSSMILPVLSRQFTSRGDAAVRRTSEMTVMALASIACVYLLLVAYAGEWIVRLAYDGRYSGSARVLLVLGILPLCYAPIIVYDDALRATGRMADVMYSYAASTAIALSVGLFLTFTYGLVGAASGILASTAASACALPYFYYKGFRQCTG